MYRQSIILFGIVLPLLLLGAVAGGAVFMKGRMTDSFTRKTSQYRTFVQTQNTAAQTEGKIRDQREHLARWKKDLSEETIGTVRKHLKTISEKIPSTEFQETGFDPLTESSSGFAKATQQKSSRFRLSFRGTYRAAQAALLELETRMPQLVLQELKADPDSQSALLNFQVTYTAWEN